MALKNTGVFTATQSTQTNSLDVLKAAISEGRAELISPDMSGVGKFLIQFYVPARDTKFIPPGMRNLRKEFVTSPEAKAKAKALAAAGKGHTNKVDPENRLVEVDDFGVDVKALLQKVVTLMGINYFKVTVDRAQGERANDFRLIRISGKKDHHQVNYTGHEVIELVDGLQNIRGRGSITIDKFPFADGAGDEDMVVISVDDCFIVDQQAGQTVMIGEKGQVRKDNAPLYHVTM